MHAHAPLALEAPPAVADPRTGDVRPPASQAVVLEPEMFFWAEDLLQRSSLNIPLLHKCFGLVNVMLIGCHSCRVASVEFLAI